MNNNPLITLLITATVGVAGFVGGIYFERCSVTEEQKSAWTNGFKTGELSAKGLLPTDKVPVRPVETKYPAD